jgi:putative transposase
LHGTRFGAIAASCDYTDMIYAISPREISERRRDFIRKWRSNARQWPTVSRKPVTGFTVTRLPSSQWKSAPTTNAIERLHEEFKRQIKTQTVLPSAETAAYCYGRCSPLVRLACEKSTAGKPSTRTSLIAG